MKRYPAHLQPQRRHVGVSIVLSIIVAAVAVYVLHGLGLPIDGFPTITINAKG
jgi:hypothetical protein